MEESNQFPKILCWILNGFAQPFADLCHQFSVGTGLNMDIVAGKLLLLEKFLRRLRTLYVALRAARNSTGRSNGVINNAIVIRLFRTALCDHLKNFSRYNRSGLDFCDGTEHLVMAFAIKFILN